MVQVSELSEPLIFTKKQTEKKLTEGKKNIFQIKHLFLKALQQYKLVSVHYFILP